MAYTVYFKYEGNWITIANFRTLRANQAALGTALILFIAVCLGAAIFFVHRRYVQIKEKSQVIPERLLDSGQIRPRDILIISNVDHRHHIDIILGLSKYLKVSNLFLRSIRINQSFTFLRHIAQSAKSILRWIQSRESHRMKLRILGSGLKKQWKKCRLKEVSCSSSPDRPRPWGCPFTRTCLTIKRS